MSEGKYKRLISNTAILAAGTFTSKVLVFLLMPLYTALLSTAEFGIADIVTQTANLIIPLAAVGICDGMFRFALDAKGDRVSEKRVFTSAFLVIMIGSVGTLGLVQALRAFDALESYVFIVAAYVVCANLHSAAAHFVRALGKTALFAVQGIINTVLTIVFNIIFLIVFDMGAVGYVLSVIAADLCVTVVLFFVARLYRYISPRSIDRTCISQMLRFSIPYIPTTMMWLITSVSDRYIVSAYCGLAENGLYAAAYKLPTLLTLVCGVFIEAWQFSLVKDATPEERSGFFSTVLKNYMGIIFMGASVIIAGAKILTSLLLADSYYDSWRFVPILVIATAFSALVSFLGTVYFLEKKSVMSMLTAMSGAVVNVILNFVLIPSRGALGAAIATAISYMAVYAVRAYDTRYYVRFDLHVPRLLINTVLIILQSLIMLFEPGGWILMTVGILIVVLIINAREIVATCVTMLKHFLKRKKT